MDFPQGADLTADRLVAGGGFEELERSFLTLDVIAHTVDLREAALPDDVHDLEAALEDVANGVVGGLGPGRGSHLGWVRFRERLPAACRWRGAGCAGKIAALGRGERAGAARLSGSGGVRRHVPDSPDGVHQARMQHVRAYLRREVELLDVAYGVEPAPAGLVDVAEQAVLPQDRGEVRRLFEVQIRHFLQGPEIRAREPVDADHPDEGPDVLLYAADVGLGAGEQFGVVVQGGVLRHQVR